MTWKQRELIFTQHPLGPKCGPHICMSLLGAEDTVSLFYRKKQVKDEDSGPFTSFQKTGDDMKSESTLDPADVRDTLQSTQEE